jgi:hypothetical protein
MMLSFLKNYWWALLLGGGGAYGAARAVRGPSAPPPSGEPSSPPVPFKGTTGLTSYLPDAFFLALAAFVARAQAKGAHISGADMLMMFLAESDCDSRIANSIGCAGLNQICNLKGVNFTQGVAAYIALPADEQLVYVERYFNNVNKYPMMRDVGSLYLTNFSPAFLGRPDNFVMYRKGVDQAYDKNAGVDFGKKGYIEVADMAKFMLASAKRKQAKYNELTARYAALTVPNVA